MHRRLCCVHLQAQWPMKGQKHPNYTSVRSMIPFTYRRLTVTTLCMLMVLHCDIVNRPTSLCVTDFQFSPNAITNSLFSNDLLAGVFASLPVLIMKLNLVDRLTENAELDIVWYTSIVSDISLKLQN